MKTERRKKKERALYIRQYNFLRKLLIATRKYKL